MYASVTRRWTSRGLSERFENSRRETGTTEEERKVEARQMTGTPSSFVRRGEIETANRVGVDEGGNKRREEGERERETDRVRLREEFRGEGTDHRTEKEEKEQKDTREGRNLRGGSEMKGRNEKEERNETERDRESVRATRERFNQTNAYK